MILAIKGSPNKKGNSSTLVDYFLKGQTKYKIYEAYDMEFHSCDDCQYCFKKIGCKYKDDMKQLNQDLYNTDVLVIASPIYFGFLSDKTAKIINRFQRFFGQKVIQMDDHIPHIKHIVFIATSGSFKKIMFKGLKPLTYILSKLFHSQIHTIYISHTDEINVLSDNVTKKIDKIKRKIFK